MKDKIKSIKIATVLHGVIAAFVVFSAIAMFTDLNFMGTNVVFSVPGVEALKFFTVLSNLLAGCVSLVMLISLIVSQKKGTELPKFLHLLNLASTTSVTLTMMVTVFFLAPTAQYNWLLLFSNSNLFMHLLTPLLCIIAFVFFEANTKILFAESLFGIIPMVLYSLYYVPNVALHLKDGHPDPVYDWYGFFFAGMNSAWIVLPVILMLTWLFSLALYKLNKKFCGL